MNTTFEGVRHFRPYLYGKKFNIYTNHSALVWLHNHKDQRSKLARWVSELLGYDYNIFHCSGKESENVDALFRLPHEDDHLNNDGIPELIEETEDEKKEKELST
jgi:RNase H-like domain found in reverse transcriptase